MALLSKLTVSNSGYAKTGKTNTYAALTFYGLKTGAAGFAQAAKLNIRLLPTHYPLYGRGGGMRSGNRKSAPKLPPPPAPTRPQTPNIG